MKVELLIEIECDDYLCGECTGLLRNENPGATHRLCYPHGGLLIERGDVTNQFERLPECMEAAAKAKRLRDKLEAVWGMVKRNEEYPARAYPQRTINDIRREVTP